jgi:hypothetical protein
MNLLYRLVTPVPPSGYALWVSLSRMSPLTVRVAWLGSLVALGVAMLVALPGGGNPSPPVRVTTDTPAYCQLLLERVHELAPLSADAARQEASDLADQGRRLCAGGEIRAGLLRLRHAVMLVMGSKPKHH